MENNRKSRPTRDVCEKIYRAIAVRTFRRISFQQHERSPVKVPDPSLPISGAGPETKQPAEAAVPVKFNHKTPPARGIQVTEVATSSAQDKHKSSRSGPEKIAPVQVIREEKPGKHIEDRFTEYINRAKLKMRSISNLGYEESSAVPVVDVGNKDHFSEYIRRAKHRLRTTSSLNVRSESFKSEGKRGP